MFARGVFSFQPARLPAYPENSASSIIPTLARRSRNSNHSRTYGIPGGGGCTGSLVRPIRRASKPFVSPTYNITVRNSFVSPTYAKTGGYATVENVGAPTFLIFPLIFRTFLRRPLHKNERARFIVPLQGRGGWRELGGLRAARVAAPCLPPVCYITTVLGAYCASPSQNGTYENPGNLREPARRVCRPYTGA